MLKLRKRSRITLTIRPRLLLLKTLTSVFAITVLSGFLCLSQTKPEIKQEANNATCSNNVTTGGVFTLTCSGLTPTQEKTLDGISVTVTKILRQELTRADLDRMVNTGIGFHTRFESTPMDANGVATLTVLEHAQPENNPAKELRVVRLIASIRLDQSSSTVSEDTDRSTWVKFAKYARENRPKTVPADVALDQGFEVSQQTLKLTRQNLDDLRQKKLRIYILTAAWWKNVSGSGGAAPSCLFLGTDVATDEDPYKIAKFPPMHNCGGSADDL
jgi:hypothetical protein